MSGVASRVKIVGDGEDLFLSTSCSYIESENLRFRRMKISDAVPLHTLFEDAVNYQAYGKKGGEPAEVVLSMVEKDISRPYYTGYLLETLESRQILGMGALECGEAGPSELQIYEFLSSEPEKLGLTGKSREGLYREMVLTLIVAAKNFIDIDELQDGRKIERVVITLRDPKTSGFSGVALDDLEMRNAVIESIFGEPSRILDPKGSSLRRFVYACEIAGLDALLTRNDYA